MILQPEGGKVSVLSVPGLPTKSSDPTTKHRTRGRDTQVWIVEGTSWFLIRVPRHDPNGDTLTHTRTPGDPSNHRPLSLYTSSSGLTTTCDERTGRERTGTRERVWNGVKPTSPLPKVRNWSCLRKHEPTTYPEKGDSSVDFESKMTDGNRDTTTGESPRCRGPRGDVDSSQEDSDKVPIGPVTRVTLGDSPGVPDPTSLSYTRPGLLRSCHSIDLSEDLHGNRSREVDPSTQVPFRVPALIPEDCGQNRQGLVSEIQETKKRGK